MPIMPMDPAKEVRMVRPFLVMRLLRDREKAVKKLMEGFFFPTSIRTGFSGTPS